MNEDVGTQAGLGRVGDVDCRLPVRQPHTSCLPWRDPAAAVRSTCTRAGNRRRVSRRHLLLQAIDMKSRAGQ